MKLFFKKENNQEFGWSISYKVSNLSIDGYEDISSIENWDLYSSFINVDYKVIRTEIFNLVWTKMLGNPSNFSLLTNKEKEIAATYFTIPKDLRDLVFSIDEQIELGKAFDEKSTEARINRFKNVRSELLNRLSWNDAMDLLTDCKNLVESYYQGREGTIEGDGVGLFDYILSRANTPYENSGLLQKTYSITGYSNIQDFANRLIDILKNGNY